MVSVFNVLPLISQEPAPSFFDSSPIGVQKLLGELGDCEIRNSELLLGSFL